jgi:hypothetical protein
MLITDAAVREAAANLAQSLGGDWAIDAEAPADGAAHLVCSDGRGVSFRPIFGGTTIQLWITGNAAPPPPNGATLAEQAAYEAQIAARLPKGHRYNKAATLVTENDEEPERIIMRTLEDGLLPAFEYKPRYVGHQPWIGFFDKVLADVTAEQDTPPALTNTDEDAAPEHAGDSVADQEAGAEQPPSEGDGERQPEDADDEDITQEAAAPDEERQTEVAPQPAAIDARNDADAQPASETPPATKTRPRKPTSKRRPNTNAT